MCETYATSSLDKKKITTDVWKQMKHFEQTLATCFSNTYDICNVCNIPDLVLQHQDEIIATYISNVSNIWRGKAGPIDSGHRGGSWRRAVAREHYQHRPRSWVPLTRPEKTLGATTRVLQRAWRGSAARPTTMGDGRRRGSERHR
jgi:hypothetical protein